MNKLIIVGNGFDLAHNLKTSYRSFLEYIWLNILIKIKENDPLFKDLIFCTNIFYESIRNINYYKLEDNLKHKNLSSFKDFILSIKDRYNFQINLDNNCTLLARDQFDCFRKIFYITNSFFYDISEQNDENWVDIENTYYKKLIEIAKNPESNNEIDILNKEFNQIKKLLHHYLLTEIKIDEKIVNEDLIPEFNNYNNYKFKEFPSSYHKKLNTNKNRNSDEFENLFLNFNYTATVKQYVDYLNKETPSHGYGRSGEIQIHGTLDPGDTICNINFGFGDEMDQHYKTLELLNDNRYLENIKSFMYLENSNYKELLNWIETHDFQVYIFGHSCGLSDRTLLNTIFEHNNCKSIKIFYHNREDGDNFREIAQNISRHFNKKTLMREKLVDKTTSKPLPQKVNQHVLQTT